MLADTPEPITAGTFVVVKKCTRLRRAPAINVLVHLLYDVLIRRTASLMEKVPQLASRVSSSATQDIKVVWRAYVQAQDGVVLQELMSTGVPA